MVDLDPILNKIASIQNCLKRVDEMLEGDLSKLEKDLAVQDVVALNVQRATQLAIDIAFYVISGKKLGLPTNFREAFTLLQKANILFPEITKQMENMVSFRYLSVHDPQALDPIVVRNIVTNHLGDFEQFYNEILDWVRSDSSS